MTPNVYTPKKAFMLFAILLTIFTSCKEKVDKYGFDEAKIDKSSTAVISLLSQRLKENPTRTLKLLDVILTAKEGFGSISDDEALNYFNNFRSPERNAFEAAIRKRYGYSNFADTKGILVPSKPLVDYLLAAVTSSSKDSMGIRIVPARYDYDATDKTKNGQMTVFFVTMKWDKTNNRWSDCIAGNKYQGYAIENHGDLCPNNCGDTKFQ